MYWSMSLFLRERWQISVLILPSYKIIIWVLTWVWINLWQIHKWLLCCHIYEPCVFFWLQVTDPPMYNVASAVFFHSLAIVRSLPLPGCGINAFIIPSHFIIVSDAWFFSIPPGCQAVWTQIRLNKMLGLIWVQTVCKGYQQMTKVAVSGQRNKYRTTCWYYFLAKTLTKDNFIWPQLFPFG